MTQLTSSLRNLKKQTEPKQILISGNLGVKLGGYEVIEVPGRSGFVYVRLLNNPSELVQVYNGVVSPIYDLPVLVKYNKDRYEIQGRDVLRYQNWGATPYLAIHGNQHSFDKANAGGGDVVWIHQEQFYPLAPAPSGTYESSGVYIAPYIYNWFGKWKSAGNLATSNVTVANPTDPSKAKFMLLTIDGESGTPHFITGSEFPVGITSATGSISYLPVYDPMKDIPLAGIRLVSGTSTIGWDEIYDVRQFYGREITGSAGGDSGVDNFLDLTDTPNSYVNKGEQYVKVKADVSGLEFVSGTSAGSGAPYNSSDFTGTLWVDLTDGGATTLHSHSGGSAHVIQNEGTPLTARAKLNFVGGGVNVTDDAGNDATIVTINTGSSSSGGIPTDGWIAGTGVWTNVTGSADDPTFVISVDNDQTDIINVGWRIKLTDTTVKYFIVTAVGAFSGGKTPITVYGGTDYNLVDVPLSSPYYSPVKAPFGFPLSVVKWTWKTIDVIDHAGSSPFSSTWTNFSTCSIPIGDWVISYECNVEVVSEDSMDEISVLVTFSDANNDELSSEYTCIGGMRVLLGDADHTLSIMQTVHREFNLNIVTKTQYYLNWMTPLSGLAGINSFSSLSSTVIQAKLSYL